MIYSPCQYWKAHPSTGYIPLGFCKTRTCTCQNPHPWMWVRVRVWVARENPRVACDIPYASNSPPIFLGAQHSITLQSQCWLCNISKLLLSPFLCSQCWLCYISKFRYIPVCHSYITLLGSWRSFLW